MMSDHLRPRLAIPSLALLVVAALGGCGKAGSGAPAVAGEDRGATTAASATSASETSGAPGGKRAVDPCALVSKQDAERLAGTPLENAVAVRETCTYSGPVTGPTAQVEVFVGDGAKKYLDIERDLGHDLKPVPGLGDEAYVEDFAVFFVKSGTWVSIHLVRLEDAAAYRQPLLDLARTVVGRI